MARAVLSAILLIVGIVLPSSAQAVSTHSLRKVFPLRELEYDTTEERLRAVWAFEVPAELRTFEVQGPAPRLTGSRSLQISGRSALYCRELQLGLPCRVSLQVRLMRKSSILELHLSPAGIESTALIAFLNRPLPSGSGPAKRHDGLLRLDRGVRGGALAAQVSGLSRDRHRRVEMEVLPGRVRLSIGGSPVMEAETVTPETFSLAFVCMRGGAELASLTLEAPVSGRSLRKLLRAGRSARDDEHSDREVGLMFREANAQATLMAEERRDTQRRILARVRKGSLGWEGPTVPRAVGAKLAQAIGRSRRGSRDLRALASDHPKEAFITYLRGLEEMSAGQLEAAFQTLEGLVARARKCPDAWRALAILHLQVGDDREALNCLQTAHRQSSDPWTQAFLALLHLRRGEFDKAKAFVRAARMGQSRSRGIDLLDQCIVILVRGPFGRSGRKHTTRHYLVESNLPKNDLGELIAALETYRDYLEKALPLPTTRSGKSRVWVFDSREEYLSFTETLTSRLEQSVGLYVPSMDTLLLFESMSGERNQRVLFHETFHQYLDSAATSAPLWLHEGLAEYYGSTTFQGGEVVEGNILEDRLATLKNHFAAGRPLVPFLDLMRMKPREFQALSAPLHYAQSWAMIHFFKRGSGVEARSVFDAYVRAILRREDPGPALTSTFGGIEAAALGHLESSFRRYVENALLPALEEEVDDGEADR